MIIELAERNVALLEISNVHRRIGTSSRDWTESFISMRCDAMRIGDM